MEAALDRSIGLHDDSLRWRSQRSNVIASNIANADTPNYKARELDFQNALEAAAGQSRGDRLALDVTHPDHQRIDASGEPEMMYRVPTQPALDGNTVDSQGEHARFAENTLRYQASLQFLSSKFRGISYAIKGQ